MVWYQKFEYAIGHWLQKAAEHMLGCVLCSPGCFSLFRGSAIMDDNVMRTYATKSTEARHYVQYDQGEGSTDKTKLLHFYCRESDELCVSARTFLLTQYQLLNFLQRLMLFILPQPGCLEDHFTTQCLQW